MVRYRWTAVRWAAACGSSGLRTSPCSPHTSAERRPPARWPPPDLQPQTAQLGRDDENENKDNLSTLSGLPETIFTEILSNHHHHHHHRCYSKITLQGLQQRFVTLNSRHCKVLSLGTILLFSINLLMLSNETKGISDF